MTDAEALSLPPREAIRFQLGKVSVGTRRWDDVWQAAHSRAFMVAGVQAGDVLEGVRGAVQKAIAEGTTLAEFRRDLAPLMERLGWEAKGKGYTAWRTRLVYETNLRGAYAAGAYEQMADPDVVELVPFWRYRHSGAKDPRKQHLAWDGLVLRHDDAWWNSHYPPNGWGCGCWVEPLTPQDLGRLGKDGPDKAPPIIRRPWRDPVSGREDQVPIGIDPGWDYNVGAAWRSARDLPSSPIPAPPDWPPATPALPATAAPPPPRPAVPPAPPALPPAPTAPPPSMPAAPQPVEYLAFDGAAEAEAALAPAYDGWGRTLSQRDLITLGNYKSVTYGEINAYLRGVDQSVDDPELMADIRRLDRLVGRAIAPLALRLARGVGKSEAALWLALAVGDTRLDAGFLSLTAVLSVAQRFAEQEQDGLVVEFLVRAGLAGVAYIHPYPAMLDEQEVLLARGARFRVVSTSRNRVVVEVL